MADDAISFLIDLKEQISAPAAAASSALGDLQEKLSELDAPLQKVEDTGATKSVQDLGNATKDANGQVADIGGALNRLPGPLGKASREGSKLGQSLKMLGGAAPYVIVAAAIALITFAAIAATAAVLSWSIGLADTARNAKLATEGIAASSKSLAGLEGILPGVEAATGQTSEQLGKMAEALAAAHVSAADMPSALKAIATATAGGATNEYLDKLKAALAQGGEAAKKAAADVQSSFGGIVASKLLSLDSQSAKLKTNLAGVFGGLKIDGLLGALSTLVALFDSSTVSGKAMKFLFESLFQPLVNALTALIPMIRSAFMTALIYVLKAYIALKPYSAEIKLLAEIMGGILLAAIVIVGISLFLAFLPVLAVIAALVIAIYIVIKVCELVGDAFDAIGAIAGEAWDGLVSGAEAALSWLEGLPAQLAGIGSNMMASLASAITGAAGAVVGAITGAVSGAIKAAKSLLGIASPSKVFAEIGQHTAAGMAGGIDAGSAKVDAAVGSMVAAPSVGAAKGGGGKSITFAPVINVEGGGNAQDIADQVEKAVRSLFDVFLLELKGAH